MGYSEELWDWENSKIGRMGNFRRLNGKGVEGVKNRSEGKE